MNRHEWKNSVLGKEFDRYLREHPEIAERLPEGAIVALQIQGDDEFNIWSQELARGQAKRAQPIVYVNIKKMREERSRIEDLELIESPWG